MRSPNRRQRITAWFHAVCYTPKGLVAVTAQHLPMSDINESLTITAQIRWRCFRVHGITAGHDRQTAPCMVSGKRWEASREASLT